MIATLDGYEYLCIHISLIPDIFIELCKLNEIVDEKGHVYCETHGGMYDLPQAGKLAHDDLVARLTKHGYHPSTFTLGL